MKKCKLRAKYWFVICSVITGLIGCVNIYINFNVVSDTLDNSIWKIFLSFFSCFILGFVSQAAYILITNLVVYFSAAALNKGFDFFSLLGLSTRALFLVPYLTFTDTVGYLILGQKLVSFEKIGLISYIPFYISVGVMLYKLLPRYLDLTTKQRRIISILLALLMIPISFPHI